MNYLNLSKLKVTIFSLSINLVDDIIACLNDNQGCLFPNFNTDYDEYRGLKVDCSVKSINPNDLPKKFSKRTIKEINKFRRKTANLNYEWMLYIDYENGEILECIKGIVGEVTGVINLDTFKNRKVVTIHNHPEDFLSPPSYDNFELLKYDFEDYEIICSKEEFWIIEAKGILNPNDRYLIQELIFEIYTNVLEQFPDSFDEQNELYGDFLLEFIEENCVNIFLKRKEYK